MFCPNCGNEIPQNSNYCPVCGKKLKDVKISITPINTDENKDTNKSLDDNNKDATRIFKPIGTIDGIDNTDEIKDIIKAVDEKISENIHKYETSSFSKSELNLDKKADSKIDKKTSSKKDDKKENKTSSKQKKETLEENKNTKENTPLVEKSFTKKEIEETPKKKKNLKELWNNFINEDDDKFSIFSSFSEEQDKNTKEDKIEISTSANTSNTSDTYMENTMGIPKIEIEKKLKESGFKEDIKKDNTKSKKLPEKEKEQKANKKNSKKEDKKTKDKVVEKTKLEDPKEKLSHKSFTDQVNEELKKLENQKDTNDNSKKDSSKLENQKEDKKVEINNPTRLKFYNFMDLVSSKLDKVNSKVVSDGKRSFMITLIIGIILSFVPIIMGYKRISFTLILLLVFKLLFNILEFYVPLNITTEKVWVETSEDEVKYFAFINWFICQVFLFVSFVLSPWDGGLFTFNLLPALTPLPIATIILFLMAITITLAQYWNQLKYENKTNFIGWYSISFILIHFVSKLFFVLTNFMY